MYQPMNPSRALTCQCSSLSAEEARVEEGRVEEEMAKLRQDHCVFLSRWFAHMVCVACIALLYQALTSPGPDTIILSGLGVVSYVAMLLVGEDGVADKSCKPPHQTSQ